MLARSLLFASVLAVASGCARARPSAPPSPASPAEVIEIEAPEPDDADEAHERLPVTRSILAKSAILDGVPCLGNFQIGRYASGALAFCNTTRPFERNGISVRVDAYTTFFPDGRIESTTLAAPKRFPLGREVHVACAAREVTLRPDGTLRGCALAAPFSARGVRCASGKGLWLRQDGSVSACALDENVSAFGIDFPKGTWVKRAPRGEIRGASFEEERTIRGVCVRDDIVFRPNGSFATLPLPSACTVQGNRLPARARLTFRPTGSLLRAEYFEFLGVMPHGEPREGTVIESFDERGRRVEKLLLDERIGPPPPRH